MSHETLCPIPLSETRSHLDYLQGIPSTMRCSCVILLVCVVGSDSLIGERKLIVPKSNKRVYLDCDEATMQSIRKNASHFPETFYLSNFNLSERLQRHLT